MRIVSWNCCRGKHDAKLPALFGLRPDLAVIQETPRPTASLAASQLWHGTNVNQGVLNLAFHPYRLEPVEQLATEHQFFLPARVIGPKERFETLHEGMSFYRDFVASAPTLVVGDLNVYWHEDQEPFRSYGVVSAYHRFFGSALRAEKHATYYFHWRRERPYHFDYCLVPKAWRRRIRQVRVGSYGKWTGARLSDHCPLIVDLTDRR